MLGGVRTGVGLVGDAMRVFGRFPRLVVPLLATWACIAALTVWVRFSWPAMGLPMELALAFGVVFLQALLLAAACSVLLELVEQVERGGRPSLRRALVDTVGENLLSMLPLVLVWSVVWFVLLLVEAVFEDDSAGSENYSAENAARALAGSGETSLLGVGLDALRKGVRMLVFLILPALAWEGRRFRPALSRGYEVFRDNIAAVATGFSLTYLVAAALFLPVGVLLEATDLGIVALSTTQWYLVIGYVGAAWSFSIYLEQMFVADLFLWQREWEQAVAAAERQGRDRPSMRDVPRPTLLDGVASLEERKLPGGRTAAVRDAGSRSGESE